MGQLIAAGVLPLIAVLTGMPADASGRQATTTTTQQGAGTSTQTPVIGTTISAAENESDPPARRLVKWNEYQGPLGSIRIGGGFLWDIASYRQDANSQQQFQLSTDDKLRDFRVLLSGKLGFERRTTWSAGIMYDAANEEWVMRQTGIMVSVPEIWGDIFVGRTKEGISLNKVMTGYGGWTMERAQINDALIPILADGVKWLGYLPKARIIWNLGVYGDALSEGQGFSSYKNQIVGRVAWLPVFEDEGNTLVHVGFSARYGKPKDDQLRLKARPGAWPAPFFLDTGTFDATGTTITALEAYFRPGRFTMGTEYFFIKIDAPASGDPFFHGGEVVFTWLFTGETRGYNTRGGYFNQVSPRRPVRGGGPGAWELVAHYSFANLNNAAITGGKFWRYTQMLNWYFSDNMRLEMNYGYGSLDRFGLVGKTHFFQARIQLQL